MNGFSSPRPRQSDLDPAPRVVPQPESQSLIRRPPFLISLLFTPINLLYAILTRAFRFLGWVFPFLPRLLGRFTGTSPARGQRRPLKPKDSAERFIREFAEEYGPNQLPFLETGYAQALDTAKRDLKFLLVILLSPEHDDTSSFIRTTLLAPEVQSYLSQTEPGSDSPQMLLWAGSVQDAEAYQVSTALHATKFPFAALICSAAAGSAPGVTASSGGSSGGSMSVAARLSGPLAAPAFLAKLRRAVERHSAGLEGARRARADADAARHLRHQQDSAYERSLATDRERARRKREAELRRVAHEKAAQEAADAKERGRRERECWRAWRAARIAAEPLGAADAVRISVRLPDGERLVRRFAADAPLEEVYAFVECHDVLKGGVDADVEEPEGFDHQYGFRLVSPVPREVFELEGGGKVKERLGRSANLIVERVDTGEDEAEDGEET